METVFLGCFFFGALFTLVSVAMGQLGHATSAPGDLWHFGHAGNGGHVSHVGHGHAGHAGVDGMADHTPHGGVMAGLGTVPLFNVSSLMAFLTWFGAAGYVGLRFGGWPALGALAGAIVAGSAGALLIALFLRTVLAGERAMDPRDYRLQGTIARVTVGVPANGTGEIVFTKAGVRRSEAAQSRSGGAIPRGAEVVIIEYQRGIARVEAWQDLVGNAVAGDSPGALAARDDGAGNDERPPPALPGGEAGAAKETGTA